jgi:hypothetical protein
MLEFLYGFLARSAVMIPTVVIVGTGIWLMLRKLGLLRLDHPFNRTDMRTWPLAYAAVNAAIFGLIFAAVAAALGDHEISVGAAAGVAAIMLGVLPMLFERFQK